jgi:hypothetical protein
MGRPGRVTLQPASAPPKLDLLGYVIAAASHLQAPASARVISEVIAEAIGTPLDDQVLGEVTAILDYYCDHDLTAPIQGRGFRRRGDGYALSSLFRAHLEAQSLELMSGAQA